MNIFKFNPLIKNLLWGREIWLLSGVDGNETTVAEGPYRGQALNLLVAQMKDRLVGKANYGRFGNHFPLLIKLIEARQDLSVQVHPNDETAHRHGKPMGKTEMWYVMPSEPGAKLYSGLCQAIDPEAFQQMVERKTISHALAQYEVSEGDVFFIPAGRVHAIGAGCTVAEIQQTSDVTYRIYDYDRLDGNGCLRTLHVAQAAECIDYTVSENYRTLYSPQTNEPVTVVDCPFFTTKVVDVCGQALLDYSRLDSFVILIAVKGKGYVSVGDQVMTMADGQALLLPATAKKAVVTGHLRLLETSVQRPS